MKMSNRLYTKIRDHMKKYVKDHPEGYQWYKEFRLNSERCHWNMFLRSDSDVISDKEYLTLKHSHVSTALNRIFKEINKDAE